MTRPKVVIDRGPIPVEMINVRSSWTVEGGVARKAGTRRLARRGRMSKVELAKALALEADKARERRALKKARDLAAGTGSSLDH
jgi:hypothetical protein